MKKCIFLLMSFICFGVLAGYAQDEDATTVLDESKTRTAKMEKLLKKQPKETKLPTVDSFTAQVWTAAAACQETAIKFENLYTREVSEPDADGVTSVEVTKPSLQDWMDLLGSLTNQAAQIATMAPAAASLPLAITEIRNPLQIKSAKNAIKDTGELFKLIGQENAAEVKAVKNIIEMKKSAKNL